MKTERTGCKNPMGPRERRFEMWANIIGGIYICSSVAVVFLIPHKLRGDIFIPYFLILCGGIAHRNRRRNAIRREEQAR